MTQSPDDSKEKAPDDKPLDEFLNKALDEAFDMGIEKAIGEIQRMAVLDVNNASFYKKFNEYTYPYQSIISKLEQLKKKP